MTATAAAPIERSQQAGHWREYLIEGTLLATFMLSACLFSILLFHPAFPASRAIPDPFIRRLLMGVAMGATAIGLNYSTWAKRSGGHYNPMVTLTFFRLGKVAPRDAAAYVAAQFAGAVLGVLLARTLTGPLLSDAAVNYAVTVPGRAGTAAALVAEIGISALLMTVVLEVSNRPAVASLTGLCAGLMVATFITLEAPVSGMSMNPARTVGSAVWAHQWTALWLYFLAPAVGMLGAAELYLRRRGRRAVFCAKLHHQNQQRCIFCHYQGR
jgi:aquaporin Z